MTLTPKDVYFRKIVREAAEMWPQPHDEFRLGPGHPAEIAELYDRLAAREENARAGGGEEAA